MKNVLLSILASILVSCSTYRGAYQLEFQLSELSEHDLKDAISVLGVVANEFGFKRVDRPDDARIFKKYGLPEYYAYRVTFVKAQMSAPNSKYKDVGGYWAPAVQIVYDPPLGRIRVTNLDRDNSTPFIQMVKEKIDEELKRRFPDLNIEIREDNIELGVRSPLA